MKKVRKFLWSCAVIFCVGLCLVLTSCGKKFTLEFNVDGGSPIENANASSKETYVLPIPEKEGYAFEGWYNNAEFSGDVITSITPTADAKFYAKWTKLYKISLVLNGASLDKTEILVKSGDSVSGALADLAPTKTGVIFAGWYLNNEKVSNEYKMPSNDISVEAKFKQNYVMEYYKKQAGGTTYEKVETFEGSDLIGNTVTSNKTFEGFVEVQKEETVSSIVVSENANANVIKKYFDRETCKISFDYNYPTNVEEVVEVDYEYGATVSFPTDLACEGYLLVGWTTKKGELEYTVDAISSVYNDTTTGITVSNSPAVSKEVTYYAVWEKGYINMFTGEDLLYVFDSCPNTIFLERCGVFFKGEYNKNTNVFVFYDVHDDILLDGKIIEDGTYCYSNEVRANLSYILYSKTATMIEDTKLYLDLYNGCKYSVTTNGISSVSSGTYVINDNNTFTITFTDGELAGSVMNVLIGTTSSGARAFQIRDDAEYALQDMVAFFVDEYEVKLNENISISLDGYGHCSLGSSAYYSKYDPETNVISLYTSNSRFAGYLKVVEIDGVQGVIFYDKDFDQVYTSGSDTLTLDGVSLATYKVGTTEVSGVYKTEDSYFGGSIVTMKTTEGTFYKFLISTTTVKEDDVFVKQYSFEKVDNLYKEYVYINEAGAYYAPMLVITGNNTASLYGFVSKGVYVKVSSGTYSYDSVSAKYEYKATEYFDGSTASTQPLDLTVIKSFKYQIEETSSYTGTYWFEYTDLDNEVNSFETVYTYVKNEYATLTFIAGKVVFRNSSNNTTWNGKYSVGKDGIISLTFAEGNMYVKVDEEEKTFVLMNRPYTQYEFKEQKINQTEYFIHEATESDEDASSTTLKYAVVTYNEDLEPITAIYEGTVTNTGETTTTGFPIYEFVYNEISFKFIQLYTSSDAYFAKYNEKYDVEYMNLDPFEILQLDGFGFQAILSLDGQEEALTGLYLIDEENQTITFTSSDLTFIFNYDNENNTFTLRGEEYGTYLLMDNQAFNSFIDLDGYDGAVIYTYENGEKVVKDDEATYVFDGDYIVLTYQDGAKQITATCCITITYLAGNYYKSVAISHKEVVSKYVDSSDWSVLLLDEFGITTVYTAEGTIEKGTCSIISDELLYFVKNDGSDACIYKYNTATAKITKSKFKLKGYYTADFESLIFTQYGYIVLNGSMTSYYNVSAGEVYTYTYDPLNENANAYGYVEELFGEFENTVEYKDKTYYVNTGYAIEFERKAEDKVTSGKLEDETYEYKYPITLSDKKCDIKKLYFAPTGTEFSVAGILTIGDENEDNDKNYACTVIRKKISDTEYETYVVLNNYYRIDIDIVYSGIDEEGNSISTYSILSMKYTLNFKSFDFMYMVYIYYMITGQDYSNREDPYGGITIFIEYDQNGEAADSYLTSYFTDKSDYFDSKGNILNFNKSNYTLNIDESTGTIYVFGELTGFDDYQYRFYMMTQKVANLVGISVVYITRVYEKTVGEYTIKAEQLVNYQGAYDTEKNPIVGTLYSVALEKNEEKIDLELTVTDLDGKMYTVSRTYDEDKKITSTTYYLIDFETIDREDNLAPIIKTFTVTPINANTYYTEDGESYVDVLADGTLELICYNGSLVYYSSMEYDSETKTYTYTVEENEIVKTYTVVINEGTAVITCINDPSQPEINSGESEEAETEDEE